jgi:hypothetical protein
MTDSVRKARGPASTIPDLKVQVAELLKSSKTIHPDLAKQIRRVSGKRPLLVIKHIIQYGQVTTQELRDVYGHNHPPRAARDVRE